MPRQPTEPSGRPMPSEDSRRPSIANLESLLRLDPDEVGVVAVMSARGCFSTVRFSSHGRGQNTHRLIWLAHNLLDQCEGGTTVERAAVKRALAVLAPVVDDDDDEEDATPTEASS